jgi:hypothetical protein
MGPSPIEFGDVPALQKPTGRVFNKEAMRIYFDLIFPPEVTIEAKHFIWPEPGNHEIRCEIQGIRIYKSDGVH